MSCKCQQCKKQYKVDTIVDDKLWETIRSNNNLLCGSCICKNIEKLDNYAAFNLKEIK